VLLDLPNPRHEAWRWADLSALPALAAAEHRGGVIDVHDLWLCLGGPRLLFVDGRYQPALSDPQGVEVGTFDIASDHPLGKLANGYGWTLHLDADAALAGPVELLHVATGGANHLAGHIRLGKGAQASLVESYHGEGWSNRLTRIDLASGARLTRAIRLLQRGGFVSLRDEGQVADGASLLSTLLGAGRADTRLDGLLQSHGEGAYVEHGGALLARGTQRHDLAMIVRHAAEGGRSQQTWRAVADERATIGLAARVDVARDAQRTDAVQSLRGLLLQRTATVNLKPELEIFADDVKCAHGATVGELDKQGLFYLASRGLAPAQARAVLTRAFVNDALSRAGEPAVREAMEADAAQWLGVSA